MPNIIIVGYGHAIAQALRARINHILLELGKAGDSITTIAYADTQWCDRPESAPYIAVRDSNADEAEKIASLCADKLNVDVEYQTICFKPAPRRGPPALPESVCPQPIGRDKRPIDNADWKLIMELQFSDPQRAFLDELRSGNNKPLENLPDKHKKFDWREIKSLNAGFRKANLKYQLRFMTAFRAYKIVRKR